MTAFLIAQCRLSPMTRPFGLKLYDPLHGELVYIPTWWFHGETFSPLFNAAVYVILLQLLCSRSAMCGTGSSGNHPIKARTWSPPFRFAFYTMVRLVSKLVPSTAHQHSVCCLLLTCAHVAGSASLNFSFTAEAYITSVCLLCALHFYRTRCGKHPILRRQ